MAKRKKTPGQKYDLVSVSNNLVEAFVRQNNLVAMKILFYIARADLSLPDSNLITLKIDTKPLLDYCNMDIRTLKHFVKKMVETSMNIKTKDFDTYVAVIPKAKFVTGTNQIEIDMYKEVMDLVKEVKNRFTVIDAKNLMKLNSKYSIKMIQLLEMISQFSDNVAKRKRYTLEELNNLFGTKYSKIKDFERFVLSTVKEELDTTSKLSFIYQVEYIPNPAGRGRPVADKITIDLISKSSVQPKLM